MGEDAGFANVKVAGNSKGVSVDPMEGIWRMGKSSDEDTYNHARSSD